MTVMGVNCSGSSANAFCTKRLMTSGPAARRRGVAVGRCIRDGRAASRSGRARAVLDDDGCSPALGESRADDPRDRVGRAPGGERYDDGTLRRGKRRGRRGHRDGRTKGVAGIVRAWSGPELDRGLVVRQRPDHEALQAALREVAARRREQLAAEAQPLEFRPQVKLVDLAVVVEAARAVAAVVGVARDRIAEGEDGDPAAFADGSSHQSGPRRLISRSSSAPGMMP